MNHSKLKTYPKPYSNDLNDLKEVYDSSSLDNCHAKPRNVNFCKTQSELNSHPYTDNCLSTNSNNKLICRINIELERMKNDKYCAYLVADPANIYKTSNDYSDARELDIDDYTDINTKIEMKNEFVKACDLVFDPIKDQVFDTVYSNYTTLINSLRRIVHN